MNGEDAANLFPTISSVDHIEPILVPTIQAGFKVSLQHNHVAQRGIIGAQLELA